MPDAPVLPPAALLPTEVSREAVDSQVRRICKIMRIRGKRRDLFEYLIRAKLENKFANDKMTGRRVLVDFEAEAGFKVDATHPEQEKQAYDRARQSVGKLSNTLDKYYAGPGAEDRIRILVPLWDENVKRDQTYEPTISYDNGPRKIKAWLHGDNEAAINYVSEQLPKLNRIEETFVRMIESDSSLYEGSGFSEFLEKLRDSRVLYRAVLGPMTDAAVSEEAGLRDVLAARTVTTPKGKAATKVYRLHHDAALMNFTLLYFFEDEDDLYRQTKNVEVLFGYGLYEHFNHVKDTAVFRSRDERLVTEFQELFKALTGKQFSRELDLERPHLFKKQTRSCDVIATFEELPVKEVLAEAQASGTGTGAHSTVKHIFNLKSKAYVPDGPHIKICVSALPLLSDQEFINALSEALERGVHVSITLWQPGQYLEQRAKVARLSTSLANHELEGARTGVKSILPHPNLFLRQSTGEFAPVSIIWIDEFIYFSPYWVGKNVAAGPHFKVLASSPTGNALRYQYEQMLTHSTPMP